jgi:hypothetical protein
MKMPVAFFGVIFIAGVAAADPYSMAIQQAQRVSNQNAAEQQRLQNQEGGANSSQPAAPAQNAPKADPVLAATMQNISGLQADIAGLNAVTDKPATDQKISLLNDLSSASQTTKASAASVKALTKDLMAALAGQKIAAAQQTKLAREIHAIFNSSHLTDTQQQTILDDVQKMLTDAGVSLDAATDVVTDLKKVAVETK